MITAVAESVRCAACKAEHRAKPTKSGLLRAPMGWHRHNGQLHCAKCWAGKYVLRAVSIPVSGPVGTTWEEFRVALNAAWSHSTAATNWMMSELFTRDERRNGQEKCPKQPKVYLYPNARAAFQEMPPRAIAALEQSVGKKYRAKRYDVLWTCAASLPTARWPQPYATPNQGWRAHYPEEGDKVPLIDVTLPGGRFTLRLRGGHEFRRQLKAFSQIESGAAVQGECVLYRVRANGNDHRPSVEDRKNGGGQRVQYRIMAKLVAWLPREPVTAGKTGTLFVRTDKDSFWFALDAKNEKVWAMHADHVKRWECERRRRLNRLSDDRKAEQRPDSKFAERSRIESEKYRHRLDSFIHEATAQLANVAARRHFAAVRYDDSETGFCGSFPWFQLRQTLAQKLDAKGIELVLASGDVAKKTPEPLANDEIQAGET